MGGCGQGQEMELKGGAGPTQDREGQARQLGCFQRLWTVSEQDLNPRLPDSSQVPPSSGGGPPHPCCFPGSLSGTRTCSSLCFPGRDPFSESGGVEKRSFLHSKEPFLRTQVPPDSPPDSPKATAGWLAGRLLQRDTGLQRWLPNTGTWGGDNAQRQ